MGGLVVMNKNRGAEKVWVRYIKQRIKQNKNFICFISGPTGSGKSWSSLRIAEECDPEFNIERCVFNGVELMKLINSGKLNSGSAIVFEEGGVGLSNRNWQGTINKMINYLMQTFRHRNFILIMNSPYLDFIDAGTRKLFHAEFRTMSIDFKQKLTKLKPQLIQYNSRMQKFYYKYLRVTSPKGMFTVSQWSVPKPSDELLKKYEKKKREFTDKLNYNILNELKKIGKKDMKVKQKCVKCGHRWIPRTKEPKLCPKCRKNPY